ncbi:Protoporphyrinogen oxidase [bacterium HR30]|nr:Protoporphyrinogen oxidase [bacterium HR30]
MIPRVAIVGGGISGLAAAYWLVARSEESRLPVEVVVLEAAPRIGGAITTEERDGFILEGGPDSFLTEKPWALELARRLGLEHRLIGTNEAYRRTYVARGNQLYPLPEGFLLLAPTRLWPFATSPLFSWRGKFRMAAEIFLPRRIPRDDESLASFVERRFGREALARVAQPLVGGIYLANAQKLSLRSTMPRFLTMEEQHRSIILAMRAQARAARAAGSGARWSLFASFDRGLQLLVDALAARLGTGRVRCSTEVVRLEKAKAHWQLVTKAGEVLLADAVVLALPAFRSAKLLLLASPSLAKELEQIPTLPSMTVNLAYQAAAMHRQLAGFGVVIPRTEGMLTWATTLSHLKYPGRAPEGMLLIRAFLGGEDEAELLHWDDERLVLTVRREVEPLLGIDRAPVLVRVHRHPETMPLYQVGHLQRVQRIEELARTEPTLALAGNSYYGVGIPDCIRVGEQAAEKIWRALSNSPWRSPARSETGDRPTASPTPVDSYHRR